VKSRRNQIDAASKQKPHADPEVVTAVILVSGLARRKSILTCLKERGIACMAADDLAHAEELMSHADFDVVVMDATRAGRAKVKGKPAYNGLRKVSSAHPGTGVVVVLDQPGLDDAIAVMQAGAADLVPAGSEGAELSRRVLAAAGRSGTARERWADREQRADRLKKLCKGLNHSRHELSRQVSSLCENLAGAYKELAEQMTMISLASEFNSLIRQELDLECLLRVSVEFILGKSGPTNAAVFLPAASGDYSLGAYVNYDCPKDSAEVLMDQLAASVAPRFDAEVGVVVMNSADELREHLGDGAEWLEGMGVMAASCRHKGECLGVITLFRPRSAPFTPEISTAFGVLAGLFAQQLSKVIHVHHRHLPKDKWGFPGDSADGADDIDLAA
jgi:DNA-binding response OmpR family regulator